MGYSGLIGETISLRGHNGDLLQSYLARPLGIGSAPGVVVIHHMPGWDPWTFEVARKLAEHGYLAVAPHLFSRLGSGSWEELAAAGRAAGGMPDAQVVADIGACVDFLRDQPQCNGNVGVIGFCSGGRQAYMMACKLDINAAVDCWGGRVIAKPEELNERQPVAPIDMTPEMRCPILGIFGNDDASPDPEQVNRTEEVLKSLGKDYEFHRYDGAGHGFFATDRANYRPEQAVDGWKKVFAFFERTLQRTESRQPAFASV
jgi:carboxymethylenebutenolidase